MTITIDTPAATKNLTTTSVVSDILGIDLASNQLFLDALIKRASSLIVSITNREFAQETVTELLPGNGSYRMVLSRTPVVSLGNISFDGTPLTQAELDDIDIEDQEAGFIWNKNKWRSTNIFISSITPINTRFFSRKWSIQYVGGYILPGQPGRTLPHDIEQACIEIVKTWYLNKARDGSIRRESIGDASREISLEDGVPITAMELLKRWIRVE